MWSDSKHCPLRLRYPSLQQRHRTAVGLELSTPGKIVTRHGKDTVIQSDYFTFNLNPCYCYRSAGIPSLSHFGPHLIVDLFFSLHICCLKAKQSHYILWRRRGERRYSSYLFMASALDGVSGQRHTAIEYYLRRNGPRYALDRRLGRPKSRSGRRGCRKHLLFIVIKYKLMKSIFTIIYACE
jgi:hypothetical protein